MTTEQIIIFGFLAAAFMAGWAARALVGGGRGAGAIRAPAAPRFEHAVNESRDQLARATRAYHAAVVRTLQNGNGGASDERILEALAGSLVALSRTVYQASRELDAQDPLTAKLQSTGLELRRLADDVTRHAREPELPTPIFDQLEQNLVSAASMIFARDRLEPIQAR